METYQHYIDDIQSAVFSPETAEPDFLRDSAALYAEACAEVNDRLRGVIRLLHRGLRSEALQLTEEEPNLLDMVASLDFPELPEWTEMLKGWGMAPPPALLIELAADINEAYADQQPLERLLKKNRLFALARAPLAVRIFILRAINEADLSNSAWETDIVALEKARIREIGDDAEAAYSGNDLTKLSEIAHELSDDQWIEHIPASLVSRVRGLHAKLSKSLAHDELVRIEPDLNAAHMAFDHSAARAVLGRWQQLAGTARLPPDDPLAQRAAPALEWIAEQDRQADLLTQRTAAVSALEQALEEDESAEQLQRLYRASSLYDHPVTPQLKSRVDQRLQSLALTARRKHRILLTATVAALVAVGSLVAWVIYVQSYQRAVAQSVESLQSLITEGRYESAREYYDNLAQSSPKIAENPEVQKQKASLDDATRDEDGRRSSFNSNMTRAEQAGPASPDRIALAEAKKLAVLPAEKARVAEMESKIAAAVREVRTKQDELLAKRIGSFREKVAGLEARADKEQAILEAQLIELQSAIENAKKELPSASPSMRAQLDPLRSRISTIRSILRESKAQRDYREKITAAVGNAAGFRAALEEYAADYPLSRIANNLPSLQDESPLWEGVMDWGTLAVPVPSHGARDITAKQAAGFLKRGRELQVKFGSIPHVEDFQKLESYMENIATRVTEDGSTILADTKQLLKDPLIGRLWMLQDDKDLRFYCLQKPEAGEASVTAKYVTGFDLKEKTTTIREGKVTFNDHAPQSIAARECLKLLSHIESKGWERTYTNIISKLARQDNIDPILRMVLLKRMLGYASRGSKPMEDAFADYRARIESSDVELSAPWMNPRDKEVATERSRAAFVLAGLPELDDIIQVAAARLKAMSALDLQESRWIGWLHRDRQGNWNLTGTAGDYPNGDLLIIVKPQEATQTRFLRVGKMSSNKAKFVGTERDALKEGRPVFLRKQP